MAKCNRCNQDGLKWKNDCGPSMLDLGGIWKLVDEYEELHRCRQEDVARAQAVKVREHAENEVAKRKHKEREGYL